MAPTTWSRSAVLSSAPAAPASIARAVCAVQVGAQHEDLSPRAGRPKLRDQLDAVAVRQREIKHRDIDAVHQLAGLGQRLGLADNGQVGLALKHARDRFPHAHRADPRRGLDRDDRRAGAPGRSSQVRHQFVFGYGSLSAEQTGVPCRLRDHRRHWGVAMDNREVIPGYKVYLDPDSGERPAVEVAYLSITPEPGASVEGLAFEVTDEELAALDRRERNYERQDVTNEIEPDLEGHVWAYVGSAAGRQRLAKGRRRGTAVIARGYLEKVPDVQPDLPVRELLRRDVGA
jgi:cation transport regulator ChaC